MALQGSIETFALPDMLRLLASTGKSGRLRLEGDRGEGHLWVVDGQLVGWDAVATRSDASDTEVLFELLRFSSADFVFEHDQAHPDPAEPRPVSAALAAAEELLEELRSLETVVGDQDTGVRLQPELATDEVTMTAPQWRAVCAIGDGATVASLAGAMDLDELAGLRLVRDLLERGVVETHDEPAPPSPVAARVQDTQDEPDEPKPPAFVAPAPEPEVPPAPEPEAALAGFDATLADEIGSAPDAAVEPTNEPDAELAGFEAALDASPPPDAPPSPDAPAPPVEALEPEAEPDVEPEPAAPPGDIFDEVFAMDEVPGAEPLLPGWDSPAPSPAEPAQETVPSGPPPATGATTPRGTGRRDSAEAARQLANLSPAAAKAVAAAARATTTEERDEALASIPEDEAALNRDLLLKFLASVSS